MALVDRKMPIVTGINDIPSTTGDPSHPNGSLMCSKFNALIDNELTNLESALTNIPSTTDELSEGTTNKYYSSSLVNNDFDTRLAIKTTDDLTEGTTNKYFSGKTTDNLPEGTTNKYYSDNRARLAITVTGNGSYDNTTGVINISNATLGIDHITLTSTIGLTKIYTIYADAAETIIIGSFNVSNGANGQDGIDGTNGVNGVDGQDGVDGRSIEKVTSVDNGDGTKTLTFWGDLAETINLGTVVLASGVDGQDGVDGTNGVDGRGITNTSYNASNGTVTFTFSDATTFTTGDLRGANGTNGTNGVDGVSPTVTVLTQSAYNALGTYDNNTFYVING